MESLKKQLDRHEREIIMKALADNFHNRTVTAHQLQISRVTLQNKIKKLGIPLRNKKRN